MCKFECKCSVRGGEKIRLLTKIVNSRDVAQSAAPVAYLATHAANNWWNWAKTFIPDYPRNTDIRAIFHGVMFLRISGFFFVFLYFERLYIFQDLNLEQTLPSIRKRDMPEAGINPTTFRLRSQSTAIELSMLVRGRSVNLLPHDTITLLVSNYLIRA